MKTPNQGSPTAVKICGLTRRGDVHACVASGVDFVGFNLWGGSPRCVGVRDARSLASALPDHVVPVAVCVASAPESVEAAQACGLPWIQIHDTPNGWAPPPEGQWIQAMRANRPLDRADLAHRWPTLVDTPSPEVGGSGRTFDWQLLQGVRSHPRLFLAGGLRPDNVGDAIEQVAPYAVDTASGVESGPGIKVPQLIEAFTQAVRAARRP